MIVFVTGASAGFGAAIARSFVMGGHRVVATARRKDRLDALAAELGDALLPIELDVRDADAVAALPGALPTGFAEVDVLVNNSGGSRDLLFRQMTVEDWNAVIASNLNALFNLTKQVVDGTSGLSRCTG